MFGRCSLLAGCVAATMGTAGVSGFLRVQDQAPEAVQYVYVLIVLGIAALAAIAVLWWTDVRPRSREVRQRAARAAVPDDLTRIEGIGPKISGLLQEVGISTFAELAETDVDRLKKIIDDAGLTTLSDPKTWPEQASLAAKGQWERLEILQEELKGGRRE